MPNPVPKYDHVLVTRMLRRINSTSSLPYAQACARVALELMTAPDPEWQHRPVAEPTDDTPAI